MGGKPNPRYNNTGILFQNPSKKKMKLPHKLNPIYIWNISDPMLMTPYNVHRITKPDTETKAD